MWPTDLDMALFTSPVCSGFKSIFRRGMPGDEIHRDALFWIPLFGRTMGVREDEICGKSATSSGSIRKLGACPI
jgi:hypothetical protein